MVSELAWIYWILHLNISLLYRRQLCKTILDNFLDTTSARKFGALLEQLRWTAQLCVGLCTKCLQSLPALPLSAPCSFLLISRSKDILLGCVLHEQHWMYFSHCEHILVQSKSTGEVIAALFHSQLAFKALFGHRHIVFLNLGSCSIYIHRYVHICSC